MNRKLLGCLPLLPNFSCSIAHDCISSTLNIGNTNADTSKLEDTQVFPGAWPYSATVFIRSTAAWIRKAESCTTSLKNLVLSAS